MRYLLGILIIVSAGFAQPVYGPYVLSGTPSLKSTRVLSLNDSTADVFYTAYGPHAPALGTISCNLLTGENALVKDTIFWDWLPNVDLQDAKRKADGSTALAFLSFNSEDSYLYMLHSDSSDRWIEDELIFADDYWYEAFGDWWHVIPWIQTVRLSAGGGNRWYATWEQGGTGWEPYENPVYCPFDNFPLYVFPLDVCICYCDAEINPLTHELSEDSVLFLGTDGMWSNETQVLLQQESEGYLEPLTSFSCTQTNYAIGETHGGQLYLVGKAEFPPMLRIAGMSLTNCNWISEAVLPDSIFEAEWHPNFGFAVLIGNHENLQILRTDTIGVISHPFGDFYWAELGYTIRSPNITIDNSGKIIASWIEVAPDNSRQLKLYAVDWDTPFNASSMSDPVSTPTTYSLSAFPNPFNSEVRIEYSISSPQQISLSIFNSLGQRIETLSDEFTTAGNHSVSWSPKTGSGVYFAKLTGNNFTRTAKLLYIR